MKTFTILFVLSLASLGGVQAQTNSFVAGSVLDPTSYSDPTNWSLGVVPGVATQGTDPLGNPLPGGNTTGSHVIINGTVISGSPEPVSVDTSTISDASITLGGAVAGDPVALDFANPKGATLANANGEILNLNGNVTNSGNGANTLQITTVLQRSATLDAGTGSLASNVNLQLQSFTATTLGTVALSGNPVTGTGGLQVGQAGGSAGNLTLSSNNIYSGPTTVVNGTLTVTNTPMSATDLATGTGSTILSAGDNTLTGNGSVGAVMLSGGGNQIIARAGSTLTTGVISVGGAAVDGSGVSNSISGAVNGAVTVDTGGVLALVPGASTSIAGPLDVASGATLNLTTGTGGAISVGGLVLNDTSTLGFNLGNAATVSPALVNTGGLTAMASDRVTVNLSNIGSGLGTGNYQLLTLNATGTAPSLAFALGTSAVVGNKELSVVQSGDELMLDVSLIPSASSYSLITTLSGSPARILLGRTISLQTGITNTSNVNNLDVAGLGATAAGGTVAGATANLMNLAPSPNPAFNTNQSFTGTTPGLAVLTPQANVTTSGGGVVPTLTTSTPATVDVVQNRTINGNADFGRFLLANPATATANFSSDVGADQTETRVTLNSGPATLGNTGGVDVEMTAGNAIAFGGAADTDASSTTADKGTRAVTGTFTTAGSQTGTVNSSAPLTGEGLTGEVDKIVTTYTADPVNERVVTPSSTTVNLGTVHSGTDLAMLHQTVTFTSNGLHDVTADATFTGSFDGNTGVTLGDGNSYAFTGQTVADSTTFGFGGVIYSPSGGAVTGMVNLGLTDEFGNTSAPVSVGYSLFVYTGQGVWNTLGGGSWGSVAAPTNWTAEGGAPGLDPNFTMTDSASFGGAQNGLASVTLDGDNPSLQNIAFNPTSGNFSLDPGTGGTITLSAGGGTATIINNSGDNTITAPLVLASNADAITSTGTTLTLSGPITGAGGLVVSGAGVTLLTETNGYTGGTELASGTLALQGNGTLGANGSALIVSGGTLDLGGSTQHVGTTTFAGSSSIQNGTLDSTSFSDTSGSGTTLVTASLAGAGGLAKTGAGTLELAGDNHYTGTTAIGAGTVMVASPTALGNSSVQMTGGTLTTDSAIRSINVNGDYTQSGGTLVLSLNGTTPGGDASGVGYSYLKVSGTAHLGGALVVNVLPMYVPVAGDTFNFVQAGVITGGFTSEATNLASLSITPLGQGQIGENNPGSGGFTLNQLPFATLPGVSFSANEKAIAMAIDRDFAAGDASADFQTLLSTLNGLTGTNVASLLPSAFSQLSPEKFSSFVTETVFNNSAFSTQQFDDFMDSQHGPGGNFTAMTGVLDSSHLVALDGSMDPALAQLNQHLQSFTPGYGSTMDTDVPADGSKGIVDSPASGQKFTAFIAGSGVLAQGLSQTDIPHSDTATASGQIGGAFRLAPSLEAGAMFGYGHTEGTIDDQNSKVKIDSFAPGVFLAAAKNGWYGNLLGNYGFDEYTQNRNIALGDLSGTARSNPTGNQFSGNIDGGKDFTLGKLTLGPTVGLQYTYLSVDPYQESGFGPGDLAVASQHADSLRSRIGGHVSAKFHVPAVAVMPAIDVTPYFSASWQHEFLDDPETITSQFSSASSAPFSIKTADPSRNSALVSVGTDIAFDKSMLLYLDYGVQAGQSNYFGQSFSAGVRILY